MVRGKLRELPVPNAIAAAISDVGDEHIAFVDGEMSHHDRGSHATVRLYFVGHGPDDLIGAFEDSNQSHFPVGRLF